MPETSLKQITAADLPQRLGRYELQELLGEGGMARVFRAELVGPAGFRKQVAVKLIKTEALGPDQNRDLESFIREARLGGLLKHPNIVDVYELGDLSDQLFIAMELVEGQTLSQLIRNDERPPASVVLEICAGVTEGLASAHSLTSLGLPAGLVHRDMKPSNVLLSWDGAVKVADFGIAITHYGELADAPEELGSVAGTLSYMSPEQMLGEPLDGRSDLFALGLVMVEIATARRLPRGYILKQIKEHQVLRAPVLPEEYLGPAEEAVPGLRRIILRCLEPVPEARYANAQALLRDIESLRKQHGVFPRLRTWLQSGSHKSQHDALGATTTPFVPEHTAETATHAEAKTELIKGALVRTNLGPALDDFVGRESELLKLTQRFESGARLVTVKGTGGAGKTRFARRFARARWDQLSGGAWFVDLTETRTPAGVLHAIAMVLDVPLRGEGFDVLASQVGHAIAGRGPVLLVLDNFEQVVKHAAVTLGRWLQTAPEANFLVTSRQPLRLEGEEVFSLSPLPAADGVALFRLRAQAAGAHLQQDAQTHDVISRLVAAVDGIPLAIELAAARAVLLSPNQLLDRLAERFKLLQGGRRGDTDRQSNLRDLIGWSWELLEPWEQGALTQLSVFRDGFFMGAAEVVLDLSNWPDAPWALDVVSSLLDKSLLHTWMVHGQPRFGMYLSIQEYAAQKLGDGVQAAELRHARHFASFGKEAFLESIDSHDGVEQRKFLALELDNLLAGADRARSGRDSETAAGCTLAGAEVFLFQGPYADGIALLQQMSEAELSNETRERLLRKTGRLFHLTGRFAEALSYFEQALQLAATVGNRRGEGMTTGNLGWLYREQGLIREAREYYARALRIARAVGDRRTEGTTLGNLGLLHFEQGRLSEAVEHYHQALVVAHEVGNHRHRGVTLGNLALLYQEQGRLSEALSHYNQALSVARKVGNRRSEGVTLGNLAHIHRNQGHTSAALQHYHQALAVAREVGNRRSEGVTLGNLGDFLFEQGDLHTSEAHLRDAIALSDESYPLAAGAFRGSLALVRAMEGDLDEARWLLSQGEPQVRGVHRMELGKFLCKKAQVGVLANEAELAVKALSEADAIAVAMKVKPDSDLGQALIAARKALSC